MPTTGEVLRQTQVYNYIDHRIIVVNPVEVNLLKELFHYKALSVQKTSCTSKCGFQITFTGDTGENSAFTGEDLYL